MIDKQQYAAIVRREIDEAMGYDADALATKRAKALDYYNGNMGDPVDGQSNIVSHDVADCLHAALADVGSMFKGSLLEFPPRSEEDETQAQLESDFVLKKLEEYDGQDVLYDAAFDALLIGNGWIKVEVEDNPVARSMKFPTDTDPLVISVAAQQQSDQEEITVRERNDAIEVTRVMHNRKLKLSCVPPERILVSASWDQYTLQELRFVGERLLMTESELIELGIDRATIKTLDLYTDDYWPGMHARDGIYQTSRSVHHADTQDAESLKEVFDVYLRIDLEENGVSELRHILYGGNKILLDEPAPFIPYATGSPVPVPHRTFGQGFFELFNQVQDGKTNILRAFENTVMQNALGRFEVVEGKTNMEDMLDGRVNGVVRVREPGVVNSLATSMGPDAALMGLEYLDKVRDQRGGAALEMNEADKQIMSASATAAAGMMKGHEKMSGFYLSNLVNTLLKSTYMLIHESLRTFMPGQTGAKIRGKWQQTDPSQWPQRDCLRITAGLTSEQRARKIAALTEVIGMQTAAMMQGGDGIVTDQGRTYNAMGDWIRAALQVDPSEYLIDPQSEEAQQVAAHRAQQMQQQSEQMERMNAAIMQLQVTIEEQKLKLDKYKHDSELRYKYYDTNLDAEVKEAEMTVDAMQTAQKQANGSDSPVQ